MVRRSKDARFDQCLWERRDVRGPRIGSIDVPDGAAIPGATVLSGFFHRLVMVKIVLLLGEHE
jgi:hypothetical protein